MAIKTKPADGLSAEALVTKRNQLEQRRGEIQSLLRDTTDKKHQGFLRKMLGPLAPPMPEKPPVDRGELEAELEAINESLPVLGEELDRQRQVALDLKIQELRPLYKRKVQELLEALEVAERRNDELYQIEKDVSFSIPSHRWNGLISGVFLGEATNFRDWQERASRFLDDN
jgi:hypothetical protein